MVAVAQLVEPWIVIPVVVGSSPISHPTIPLLIIKKPHTKMRFLFIVHLERIGDVTNNYIMYNYCVILMTLRK